VNHNRHLFILEWDPQAFTTTAVSPPPVSPQEAQMMVSDMSEPPLTLEGLQQRVHELEELLQEVTTSRAQIANLLSEQNHHLHKLISSAASRAITLNDQLRALENARIGMVSDTSGIRNLKRAREE